MKRIISFLKDTILGGLFFLLPLFVIYAIAQKIWKLMSGVGERLAEMVGLNGSIAGIKSAPLVSSFLILLLLFLCGVLYRVSIVDRFRNWLDGQLLKYIPGYDIYKANIEKKLKHNEVVPDRPVILMTINGVGHPAVITDTLKDGRKVVFVADKPGGTEGKTYIVTADKIETLNVKESIMNKLHAQQGKGWAENI
jgi:uncharacterized membrane protein